MLPHRAETVRNSLEGECARAIARAALGRGYYYRLATQLAALDSLKVGEIFAYFRCGTNLRDLW